jgi:hypothetical protein
MLLKLALGDRDQRETQYTNENHAKEPMETHGWQRSVAYKNNVGSKLNELSEHTICRPYERALPNTRDIPQKQASPRS